MPTDTVAPQFLTKRLSCLNTALVCDVVDQLGIGGSFVGAGVGSTHTAGVVAGTAFTMTAVEVDGPSDEPYELLLKSFNEMSAGQVVVITTSGEQRSSIWGELLTTAAQARGVSGLVTDGLIRDVEQIERLGFPVYGRGTSPLDCAGRLEVIGYGEPITCGDAVVRNGDYILGDAMGVTVIPHEAIEEVLTRAEEKRRGENHAQIDLAKGDPIDAVFARYGIL